jgi:DNA repair protein RadC
MRYETVDKLSDDELVAIILGKKVPDISCQVIADALVRNRPSSLEMMVKESGVYTPARINRVEAAIELGRRNLSAYSRMKTERISTPEQVWDLMSPLMVDQEREKFFCICLSTKNHIKLINEVSVGSNSASIVHPRELFREAVRLSAGSVVVVHNHPSGDTTPSGADIQLTRRLVKAGDTLGIEVLDHVIIGEGGYTSLRDEGLM